MIKTLPLFLRKTSLFLASLLIAGSAWADYCTPDYITGTGDGDYIDGVELEDISNFSGPGDDWNDYTDLSTVLNPGITYDLTVFNTPSWDEFYKQYDRDGDGAVAFEEIAIERRDYWRGLDRNRDGKYTKEDWDLRKVGNARAENVLVAVKPGGSGDISHSHVAWKFRKALPYVPSPLYYNGRIYLVKDGGLMSSLDANTGDPFYAQERLGTTGDYYASPVAADGRIYVVSLPGKLSVIKAGGTKPEVLHQADFGVRILATPALVGERIYLRTATDLWAFGVIAGG